MAGSFVILDFPDGDPSLVYLEAKPNSLSLENRDEIRRYNLVFQNLTALALSPDASLAYLAELPVLAFNAAAWSDFVRD